MQEAIFGYIGSKFSLLEFIDECLKKNYAYNQKKVIFCDLFAGTGIVGYYYKNKFNIISNEIEDYGFLSIKSIIEYGKIPAFKNFENIETIFEILNKQELKGFIYKNYSPSKKWKLNDVEFKRKYFTKQNALRIDGIRNWIETNYNQEKINNHEYNYLLLCLIQAVSKTANTASVYEAYLKKFKNSALKSLIMKPFNISPNSKGKKNKVFQEDARNLITKIKGDILYLDPPFNSRQYSSNYHILKTIIKNDKPKIKKGITGNRTDNFKSNWCIKSKAKDELEFIIKNAKFNEIYLSYNCDGIIKENEVKEIFEKYGKFKIYKKSHNRFKAGKRNYKKDKSIVYLYACFKEKRNDKYKK